MTREFIIDETKKIGKTFYSNGNRKLEAVEQLLLTYLESNPNDIEILIRTAFLEYQTPWLDYIRSGEYLERVLELEPFNVDALLLAADIIYTCVPYEDTGINSELLQLKGLEPEKQSMVYLALARLYEKSKEEFLVASVKSYDHHFWNKCKLGELYLSQGKIKEAKILIESALENVKIYDKDVFKEDPYNVRIYFNEIYKGIWLNEFTYNRKKEFLLKIT